MKNFDPNEAFDVVAEHFRKEISEVACKMLDDPVYQKLSLAQQLEAFMAGSLTAIIGCSFAHIRPESRDEVMLGLVTYLPQARVQAEAMITETERSLQ